MANLGDVRGASESYRKAIALLEPVAGGADATDAEQATLATTYLVGAGLSLNEGRAEAALATSKKGLSLRQALAARLPNDADRQMDVAQAWQYVAYDASAAGKRGEAAAALARQAAILEAQRRSRPADRAVRRSLGQNLYLAGDAASNAQDLPRALESYRAAAALQDALAVEDPSSVTFRRDLAYSYMAIGNTQEALGDRLAALDLHRRALATFEEMAAADRKSTDPLLGVAMGHHNCGDVLAKLGRSAEALAEYRRARAAYEAVVAASPSGAWASGMLGTLYLQTADLEAGNNPTEACLLYGKAVGVFAPIEAAGALPSKREKQLAHARERLEGCGSRPR